MSDFDAAMQQVSDLAQFFNSCNATDIEFSSGHMLEVYLAITPSERKQGLAALEYLDNDGMLFCYDEPTDIAFTMENTLIDLDIAWYDQDGNVIQTGSFKAGDTSPIFCPRPFSYVLETKTGALPSGNFKLSSDG